jgi:type III pantothenate kinase
MIWSVQSPSNFKANLHGRHKLNQSIMTFPFIAVDIGNARMKVGVFDAIFGNGLPEPTGTLALDGQSPQFDGLISWLSDLADLKLSWLLASVNRPSATGLIQWLRNHRPDDAVTLLSAGDLPLAVRLKRPDMVGIDRLVDAVAVNHLRESGRTAVIVDVGTAITVDLVSADGAFLGGSILPGLAMSARALHDMTDLLPLIDVAELSDPPLALGTSTESAMRSGLFWGTVGAIRQLIEQLGSMKCATASRKQCDENPVTASVPLLHQKQCNEERYTITRPQIFLTGGAGATVADLLGPEAQYIPHLTLSGIALSVHL